MPASGRPAWSAPCAISRSASGRACSTTSACSRRSSGTSATSRRRYGVDGRAAAARRLRRPAGRAIARASIARVQEALTNCIRHAQARTHHGERSAAAHDRLDVSVTDDGVGLDVDAAAATGSACAASRSASRKLDGVMTHSQRAGRRARRLTIRLPLPAAPSRRWRLRVLLADDHGIVRRGLRSLLEEAGVVGRRRSRRRSRGGAALRRASARSC